jgi:hypothetical protein
VGVVWRGRGVFFVLSRCRVVPWRCAFDLFLVYPKREVIWRPKFRSLTKTRVDTALTFGLRESNQEGQAPPVEVKASLPCPSLDLHFAFFRCLSI